MARTSSVYYIAPSAISIVPNCNGTASDLAVTISRGAKVRVYYPPIYALGMVGGTYQEWTLRGRNRRLADPEKPYTIYARLRKVTDFSDPDNVSAAMADGYLMFVPQDKDEATGEWNEEPYILTPNTSSTGGKSSTGADGKTYPWQPIPSRQTENGRTDYWWIKLGTVSAPDENNQRTVDLDTGILGTEEYNNRWRLNPDDLPDNPVRTVITDRGSWTQTPQVIYRGPTGTRTPDGTLPAATAAALGWEGTEPLTFTNGEPIAEPYHRESLTRQRFISKRLNSEYAALTDAELYEKLTTVSKGWEEENELETSRVWREGALWECLVEGTSETPTIRSTEWRHISGGTFSLGFYTDEEPPIPIIGFSVRPGFINETVVPYLLFGQEDISDVVTEWLWTRESNNSALDETWKNTAHTTPDDPASPLKSVTRIINVKDGDLPEGWSTGSGKVSFKCTARFVDDSGEESEIINSIRIV